MLRHIGRRAIASVAHRRLPVWPALRAEGMISERQASTLYRLAQGVPKESCIVEIGSYRGRSSIALALGSLSGGSAPVFAVDPQEDFTGVLGGRYGWRDREQFMRNVVKARCAEAIRLVNLPSAVAARAWERRVSLLHIDGDHAFEGVASDFFTWQPHLTADAIVAFDDATDPSLGPHQLIHGTLTLNGWEITESVDKMIVMTRPTR